MNKFAAMDDLAVLMRSNLRQGVEKVPSAEKVSIALEHLDRAAEIFDEIGEGQAANSVIRVMEDFANKD